MDPEKFDLKTRRKIRFLCRSPITAANGKLIPFCEEYGGFKINWLDGEQAIFLLLDPQDRDMFAIDVTSNARLGQFLQIYDL